MPLKTHKNARIIAEPTELTI